MIDIKPTGDTTLSEEVLRTIAERSIEEITDGIANLAESLALDPLMEHVSGNTALRTFAHTIRIRNAQMYPKKNPQS